MVAGTSSRSARCRTQPAQPPAARCRVHDTALAYPPTRKKTGITCRNRVSHRAQRTEPSASSPVIWPPAYVTSVTSQCPSTTTHIAPTRSRSACRFRFIGRRLCRRPAAAPAPPPRCRPVGQDLAGHVAARDAGNSATPVRRRARLVKPAQRGSEVRVACRGPGVEHLAHRQLAVEDVAADQPVLLLHLVRSDDL